MLKEHLKRLECLRTRLSDSDVQGVAINAGADLKYFTGLDFHLSERPAILLIPKIGECVFIFPEFEKEKANQSAIPVRAFPYPEDPQEWVNVARAALESFLTGSAALAVSPMAMRFLETDLLQQASPGLRFISGAEIFKDVYISKDAQEIVSIRKAVAIAETALIKTLPHIKPGKTEREIANLLVVNLLNEGSDAELAFGPIIASGPNSANPHANPGKRVLQAGDMLVIDWGARFEGYVSDITRTFALEFIPPDFESIAKLVLNANLHARQRAAAGVPANEVDAAAREVIQAGGFGPCFLHRTGHGIGQNAHEHPYISAVSTTILQPGMVFTIEPGIYLSGRSGVRIEDNMLITQAGAETLTSLPRELVVI